MLLKYVSVVVVLSLTVSSQEGCRTPKRDVAEHIPELIGTKDFVAPPGQAARSDNPPCMRHGMEDSFAIAKRFGQSQVQSFAIIGKDIPAKGLLLKAPNSPGNVSTTTANVEDDLREIPEEARKSLITQAYASCVTVVFRLGGDVGDVRASLSAGRSSETPQPCSEGSFEYTKCQVGNSGWSWFHQDQYFVATFKNWDAHEKRAAKIELYRLK